MGLVALHKDTQNEVRQPKNPKGSIHFFRVGALVLGISGLVALAGGSIVYFSQQKHQPESGGLGTRPAPPLQPEIALKNFASCNEIAASMKEFTQEQEDAIAVPGIFRTSPPLGLGAPAQFEGGGGGGDVPSSLDYSRTNVQVEGVDEADIVKTDGRLIYALSKTSLDSGSGANLQIVQALPSNEQQKVAIISFAPETQPSEFFVHGEWLLVFGTRFIDFPVRPLSPTDQGTAREGMIAPEFYGENIVFLELYSLRDPKKPKYHRTLEFEGSYLSSRKIGRFVYFVLNSYPSHVLYSQEEPTPEVLENIVPRFRDTKGAQGVPVFQGVAPCGEVQQLDPFTAAQFLTVVALPIDDPSADFSKVVIAGAGANVYASHQNLYIASPYFEYSRPPNLEFIGFPIFQRQDTIINKFKLDVENITHVADGRVPGTILNQFSMDEFEDHFRIATTVGEAFGGNEGLTNAVYVMDQGLTTVGSLEGLAPGERIYSARFMGRRAYLVTFKTIDPFFTIDLSSPQNPRVLGFLKIPGFSDYLHPYDENHVIGVGTNTQEDPSGEFAWFQGMKLALFDVTDPQNPKELHKIDVGDRGTDSPAFYDHRAFFYDPVRRLLVLPVLVAEIPQELKQSEDPLSRQQYGIYTFQGSYVWRVTPEQGFVLLGRVTHIEGDQSLGPYYSFPQSLSFIYRNLRIDETLYSISDAKVQAHSLADLSLLSEVKLIE